MEGRVHWLPLKDFIGPPWNPFLHTDNNDNFSLHWINFKRRTATARGHKWWSAATDFEPEPFFAMTVAFNLSGLHLSRGRLEGNRRPSCEHKNSYRTTLRRQEKFLGSNEYLPRIPSVPLDTSLTRSAVHFHFYKGPTIHLPATFDQRRLPVLIWDAYNPSYSTHLYPYTRAKWAGFKRTL